MTIRTFIQQGQAYSSTPVDLVVKIDGVTVFSGAVSTLDQPVPVMPDISISITDTLFSWTNTVDFAGTKQMEITVSNGLLVLADTLADHFLEPQGSNCPPAYLPSGPAVYGTFYQADGTSELIGTSDPFSGVEIDGVAQDAVDPELRGQWYWAIASGSVFTCTVNIQAGVEATPWSINDSYVSSDFVTHNSVIYVPFQPVPSGINIMDTAYWLATPAADWSSTTGYSAGDIVKTGGVGYKALQTVAPGTSITDLTYWQPLTFTP